MKAGSVLVVGALVALAACSKDEKAAEASVTPGEGIAGQLTVLGVPVAGATVTLDGATPVLTATPEPTPAPTPEATAEPTPDPLPTPVPTEKPRRTPPPSASPSPTPSPAPSEAPPTPLP